MKIVKVGDLIVSKFDLYLFSDLFANSNANEYTDSFVNINSPIDPSDFYNTKRFSKGTTGVIVQVHSRDKNLYKILTQFNELGWSNINHFEKL